MKKPTKAPASRIAPISLADVHGGSGSNTVFRNGETGILRTSVQFTDGTLPLPMVMDGTLPLP